MSALLTKEFSAVPEELKALPRWVNWRMETRDGRATKVPVDPNNGRNASCSDPQTWGTYKEALERFESGAVDGIGIQLGDGILGIDLDHCRNPHTGVIEPWALQIITSLNSYSEFSPSGHGVHILVKGALPPGSRRKGHVEMYGDGRFFTATGNHIDNTPTTIGERQEQLGDLHARIFGAAKAPAGITTAHEEPGNQLSDDELIDRAHNAENREKLSQLWHGDISGYDSHSEADLALCMILAFWTGPDSHRMDRLFRRSGLLDLPARLAEAERVGYGFVLPEEFVPNVPRKNRRRDNRKARATGILVNKMKETRGV